MRFRERFLCNDPLGMAVAAREAFGDVFALLHASSQDGRGNALSYLGCDVDRMITHYDPSDIKAALSSSAEHPAVNAWFGYIGYETVRYLEPCVPIARRRGLPFPDICLVRFKRVYVFDHHQGTVTLYACDSTKPRSITPMPVPVTHAYYPRPLRSHAYMPDSTYVRRVSAVLEHIRAGDMFQANITRKFGFEYRSSPDPLMIYKRLIDASPSGYGALLSLPFGAVVSSSPEMFITISPEGMMKAAPIKGSAPRHNNQLKDAKILADLCRSEKDRAENIMIADLYRNDMSRVCEPGSVKAPRLCAPESFRTVHHLVSDIEGTLRPDVHVFDAIAAALPPGSMTGAPKPEAMKWCARYENIQRGVYSGVLGMFGGDGSVNLSVVIRTILLQGLHAETQSGGGIVADSDPMRELAETKFKMRGVAAGLGIHSEKIY